MARVYKKPLLPQYEIFTVDTQYVIGTICIGALASKSVRKMCSHVASWPYPSDHFDQNNDGAWCAKAIDSLVVVVKAFFRLQLRASFIHCMRFIVIFQSNEIRISHG